MVVPPNGGPSTSVSTSGGTDSPASAPPPILRAKTSTAAAYNGNHLPFSMRRAEKLDMNTVERRGKPLSGSHDPPTRTHINNLPEAPTFRPTAEEWKDPMQYIRKISEEGRKYGIVKIIPPDSWNPDFAIDTERFHFRTRKQELNCVEGGTRANVDYLDRLTKFHNSLGMKLNRFPSVDKRPLDLYELKKAVESRGGFERVCKGKKWAEIGRDLGYSGKIMSSLSTSLKNSYAKWLEPYERWLRGAKPGVQMQLEQERGGPYGTPSPGPSPMRKSNQHTPSSFSRDSPAIRASLSLHDSITDSGNIRTPLGHTSETPLPVRPSGFTPVNHAGFTPVNAASAFSSFTAAITANGQGCHREFFTKPQDEPMASREVEDKIKPIDTAQNSFSTQMGYVHSDLKRKLSEETEDDGNKSGDSQGRRSKRLKQEGAPTVSGSHMMQPRFPMPRWLPPRERGNEKPGDICETCGRGDNDAQVLLCESCYHGYHTYCLDPPLQDVPDNDWHCPKCLVGTGEFGFEEGGIYSLKHFQEKAYYFKENHFTSRMPFDPVLQGPRPITEDDVEREFWRLVLSITETVEVEYGADIHSTSHGSGFPTLELNMRDPYSVDPWNLNVLPLDQESLFRFIKSDISGMTVPWLYVGMCFSTFCWHNEDHHTYSANYQHFGATKTWYGIPGEDAERFEDAMRQAVPELFESQPDLLYQLVTLLTPEQLKKKGVNLYAVDQRAGQFVITFPRAYHAGFNHGFNFNEAVNFAPSDWEPFGRAEIDRLRSFRRQPCFSHDELLLTAASAKDVSIKTAKWLAPALRDVCEREKATRTAFEANVTEGKFYQAREDDSCRIPFERKTDSEDVPDEEYVCSYCKTYSYLSRFACEKSQKVACLDHVAMVDWGECEEGFVLHTRMTNHRLEQLVQKISDKARLPESWKEKFDSATADIPKPQLKVLRSLLSEAERIPWDIPEVPDLKQFVDRCNDWVEEATNYITRKQQNRRKNEKLWRKGSQAKLAEMEERDRGLRKLHNIRKLLAEADHIGFECPEITTLQERADAISEYQRSARDALSHLAFRTTQQIEELIEVGKGFFVEIPEVEMLDRVVRQMKWTDTASDRARPKTLQDVDHLLQTASELGVPEHNDNLMYLRDQKSRAEMWEAKAKELMAVENIHFAQLDAFSRQAHGLPVSQETLAAIDAILRKQRETQEQIVSLYERCRLPNFRQRPLYKDVRDVMEGLESLNSKPPGTSDLEKEQKRHEDWMRRGKKLFGKSNAPLHILLQHMKIVENRNKHCFDLEDKPRMPVEPASREHTPEPGTLDGHSGSSRDVFCLCRTPEAGMMIECHVCHEWYHSKCLKIARGKVKEDEDFTCPICDWRVKIPRDAARPKLEELTAWQAEIPRLPFQPEEEECLNSIVGAAQAFRDSMQPYVQPVISTREEVPTQRFYLRKIEGADILLGFETNFFRQELHRLVPIAPEAPAVLEVSLSTRKPRPTKQQKLMAQLGVDNPDDLPQHLRTKPYNVNKRKAQEGIRQQDKLQQAAQQALQPSGTGKSPGNGPHVRTTSSSNIFNSYGYNIHPPTQLQFRTPLSQTNFPQKHLTNHTQVSRPHSPYTNQGTPGNLYTPVATSPLPLVSAPLLRSPFAERAPPVDTSAPPANMDPNLFSSGFGEADQHPHQQPPPRESEADLQIRDGAPEYDRDQPQDDEHDHEDGDIFGAGGVGEHNSSQHSVGGNYDGLFADLTNHDEDGGVAVPLTKGQGLSASMAMVDPALLGDDMFEGG